ncbi:MAG: hypothetical protein HYV01_24515 [Deltaproteobacteria bacterium]|nr:hypothetical protein [Deltaproteobacteria bacterium]
MDEIRIVDTTVRDGNTSLWAHNMTTGMMHPVLRHMDQAGFDSMEFFVSGRFKKVVREQRDNPWDWVRYGQKEVKNTRLRYHGGLSSGFSLVPPCMPRLVIECVVSHGITLTRLSDPWNDYEVLGKEITELRTLGMESVVNLIYSVSPRHTDEYYARKAREAAAIKPYRICFKDVGGMLTPERTRTLAKIIRQNVGDATLEFHAHCNNGLAPINVLEAVKEGIHIVHTSVPPLANGSAQPSIFNVARNLRALGYKPLVNEKVLEPVEQHFYRIAKEEGLPIGAPRQYDETWYRHQVPGGMISNLRHQLKMLGKEDQMEKVLDEIVQVRSELGYPIMVTPFAQFVGSQATAPEVKAKILDRPRARELEKFEVPDVSLDEVRKKYGGPSLSDEELILRFYAGPEFVDALKHAPPRKEYLDSRKPLIKLIDELGRKRLAHVYIRKGDLSLSIGRHG